MENSANQTQSDRDHSYCDLSLRIITPEIIHRLDSFFEFMPPHDFRDHLIELYHNYIMHEHESLPHNFRQLAEGMVIFSDFLKFVTDEAKYKRKITKPVAAGGESNHSTYDNTTLTP